MVSAQWKTAHIFLEAQHYDLIMLGQQTFFHFETQDTSDDTLSVVVKQSPCPVVAVPATLPRGRPCSSRTGPDHIHRI